MSFNTVSLGVAAALTLFSTIGVAQRQDEPKGQQSVEKSIQGMAHRVSEIQGMTVKNAQDKELGTVKDIVIDVREGQVKYAALSYGGFVGFGDKLFAVPWYAFEHRHDASDDEHSLVLSIDEATLKKAPGFDQSEWPNLADGKVAKELEKHYGKFRQQRKRQAGINIKAGPVAVDVDVQRNRDQVDSNRTDRRRAAVAEDVVHRAGQIAGMTVKNTSGKELGSVNDLVIDMKSGNVRYAALSYGGFLGLGDKLFAAPWDLFECQDSPSGEKYHLVLAVDEATLRKAPGFDQDNWPNLADPDFGDEIDEYYNDTRRTIDRGPNRATDR